MEVENQSLAPLLIHDEKPVILNGMRGVWFFFRLVSWWFAYATMMGPLPSIIFPAQIEKIVGSDNKEKYNGFVPAFGAAISLIITPIAGIYSDRSNSRIGRRKIFVIIGSIISIVFFMLCGTADKFSNIWVFVAFTMGLQFGTNFAAGPYAGLIPDNINQAQVGKASGYTGLAAAMGYLVGLISAGLLTARTSLWHEYIFLGTMFVLFSLPTIIGFKERPNYELHEPLTVKGFFKSFYLDPAQYRTFYYVILTRFLEQMGYYTVLPFLQYFIQDVVFANKTDGPDPEFFSSIFMSCVVAVSVPASIVAGVLSDKYGRKKMVMMSMGIMTTGVGGLIGVCYFQNLGVLLTCGVVFGLGYGSFLAVDWALALDSLPEGCDAAKDMGIWHMAFVLPQVIAPIVAGQILSYCKEAYSLQLGYTLVFVVSCIWFLMATLFVLPIRLRTKTGEPTFKE